MMTIEMLENFREYAWIETVGDVSYIYVDNFEGFDANWCEVERELPEELYPVLDELEEQGWEIRWGTDDIQPPAPRATTGPADELPGFSTGPARKCELPSPFIISQLELLVNPFSRKKKNIFFSENPLTNAAGYAIMTMLKGGHQNDDQGGNVCSVRCARCFGCVHCWIHSP